MTDSVDRVSATLAESWSTSGLHDALQVIADGIRELGGFAVAAVSVLHDNDSYEVIAVSGDDPGLQDLIGGHNPKSAIDAELARAEDWGEFKFVSHAAGEGSGLTAIWTPEVVFPDSDLAWHHDDLLVAELRDARQQVRGMLSIDVPVDGLRPGAEHRRILNTFAIQAGRVLSNAVERHALTERLRLAEAARRILRRATDGRSVQELLEECRELINQGLRVDRHLVRLVPTALAQGSFHGLVESDLDPRRPARVLIPAIDRIAQACWTDQQVTVISPTAPRSPQVNEADHAAFLTALPDSEFRSVLVVPLGAGPECLGCMLMSRVDPDGWWTADELQAAQEVGRDVGQAILNARMHERDRELVRRLEELDRYKSQLIATMAHEPQNPLAAVAGHAALLASASLPPGTATSVQAIRQAGTRLNWLVGDLLQLSRVSTPDYRVSAEAVDLGPLIKGALELQQVLIDRKRLDVETVLHDPACLVTGDHDLLGLVVTNLLSNAVKYSTEGGTIRLSVEPGDAGETKFIVHDHGLGISESDQEHLFEEFNRGTNPEALREPGTGLGLTIVRRVAERHGGRIDIVSELGRGTTATVTLPAAGSAG